MAVCRALLGVMLLGASLAQCGGNTGENVGAGGAGSAGSAGAAGSKTTGTAGTPELLLPDPSDDPPPAGQTEYPAPFAAGDCPAGPPPTLEGAQECVTLEQLLDDDVTLSVIGGFDILGTPAAWRCPTIAELMADSGCHLAEGCCINDAYCGPIERPMDASTVGGGGAGGFGGAPVDQHECCYYMVRQCGV